MRDGTDDLLKMGHRRVGFGGQEVRLIHADQRSVDRRRQNDVGLDTSQQSA